MESYRHIACLCTGKEGYGVAHVLKKLAENFPQILFISQAEGDFWTWLVKNSYRCVSVPELVSFTAKPGQNTLDAFVSLASLGFKIRRAAKALTLVLDQHDISIVHSHWLSHHLISGCLPRHKYRKIWHMHGIVSDQRWKGLIRKCYSWTVDWGADDLICVSRYAARRYNLKKARIHVVYNGAEPANVTVLDRPLKPPFQLIAAARMIRIKGFHLCLEAFAKAQKKGIDAHLHICGGPLDNNPYYQELVELANRLDIASAVTFHGAVSDVRERNKAMHLALHLHAGFEPCGIWVQEAMLDGLPVVATRCGGPEELIDEGQNGFLAAKTNVDEQADAIVTLLTDEALYRQMSQAAFQKATSEFSTKAFIENMNRIYDFNANRNID